LSRVSVTFDGNSRGAVTAAKQTAEAIGKVKLTAAEQASANVKHGIEQRRSLQSLAAEYTKVATTAKRGSEEQLAAFKLEQKALRELNNTHGVHSQRLQSGTNEMGKFSRGALAGSGAMRGFGRNIAFASMAFIGSAGLIAMLRSSVGEGAKLETQTIRTTKVFGAQAAGVKRWSENSATALRVTRAAALDTVSAFGQLFAGMDVAPAKVAPMSKALVQLAADTAAFTGKDVGVVNSAFLAAIAGRTRGLKQLGTHDHGDRGRAGRRASRPRPEHRRPEQGRDRDRAGADRALQARPADREAWRAVGRGGAGDNHFAEGRGWGEGRSGRSRRSSDERAEGARDLQPHARKDLEDARRG